MSLRSNVGPAIVCLLLLVFGGARAWLTGRSYVADLRSYYRQEHWDTHRFCRTTPARFDACPRSDLERTQEG